MSVKMHLKCIIGYRSWEEYFALQTWSFQCLRSPFSRAAKSHDPFQICYLPALEMLWSDMVLWPFCFFLIFYGQNLFSSVDLTLIFSYLPSFVAFSSYALIDLLNSWKTLMVISRALERLQVTDFQIQLSCLIKGHVSPSDIVFPCLSRFWWSGKWWIPIMQRIIWRSVSLLFHGNRV